MSSRGDDVEPDATAATSEARMVSNAPWWPDATQRGRREAGRVEAVDELGGQRGRAAERTVGERQAQLVPLPGHDRGLDLGAGRAEKVGGPVARRQQADADVELAELELVARPRSS
jgi:hypothetical protein